MIRQRPEDPSWGTQFGRQLLQMLAQGVIGGGTNLLKDAIMQGIRSRDQNEMLDKQIQAHKDVAQANAASRSRMKGMELGAKSMMKQADIGAANMRRDLNAEDKGAMAISKQLGAAGDVPQSANVAGQRGNWQPTTVPFLKQIVNDKPEYEFASVSPEPGKVGAEGEPGYLGSETFRQQPFGERAAGYAKMLPAEMQRQMAEGTKTAMERNEPVQMRVKKYQHTLDMAKMMQGLRNSLVRQGYSYKIATQIAAGKAAAHPVSQAMGFDTDYFENLYSDTPQAPEIPGAPYPMRPKGMPPKAIPAPSAGESLLNQYGLPGK